MPGFLKQLLHKSLSALGYKLVRKTRKNEVRLPLLAAKNLLLGGGGSPVMFDIGANIGQTTLSMRDLFPGATVHAFEPGSEAFARLSESLGDTPGVHLHQVAIGSAPGRIQFHENAESTMSSVLPLGSEGWGIVKALREVELTTVDEVCQRHDIQHISILKSDTQGYELEVLRGATEIMEQGQVDCVFFELIFSDLYQGKPRFDTVLSFLLDRGYVLVSVYDIHQMNGVAAWADALFIHRRCLSGKSS